MGYPRNAQVGSVRSVRFRSLEQLLLCMTPPPPKGDHYEFDGGAQRKMELLQRKRLNMMKQLSKTSLIWARKVS
jgi:hypothetical protein